MYTIIKFLVIITILIHKSEQSSDKFHEELFLKPLPTGHINSFFQFTTEWHVNENNSLHHTHLVSRSLAEIFLHYNIRELHVSLTHGLWRYDNWGYPVVDAAPGAEVWAWFDKNITDEQIDEQWKNLCGTLSGLLCASLSFIDSTNTISPEYSFRPQFSDGAKGAVDNKLIRYATLPREIVCTENLTPWKKLLPCSNQEGFLSLLNSGFIHSTNYHSIGLHVRTLCKHVDCDRQKFEIKQTVNLVFDKQIFSPNRDWSIRKLFGQGLNGACYLSESSKIYLDVTDQDFELSPEPHEYVASQRGGSAIRLAAYDVNKLKPQHMFNVAAIYKDKSSSNVQLISSPPLYAKRFLLGVGQERGKIVTKVTNMHWTSLNVIIQENIPWFIPMYLHSLIIKNGHQQIQPSAIKYIPGERRERPYHLEIAFKIPKRTTVELSIEFDYIFLKWLEYPPDANHGHYLGSAVISAQLPVARNYTAVPVDGCLFADTFNASRPSYFIQIRTESLLVSLPTPDFSMPYNVICLACTVVALAFGPIHNISTKKIVLSEKNVGKKSVMSRLKSYLFKNKDKVEEETIVDDDDEKLDADGKDKRETKESITELNAYSNESNKNK